MPVGRTAALTSLCTSTKSEIAREALDRIGKLYDIERDINGQPDVHATRQKS
jgi:transposase